MLYEMQCQKELSTKLLPSDKGFASGGPCVKLCWCPAKISGMKLLSHIVGLFISNVPN